MKSGWKAPPLPSHPEVVGQVYFQPSHTPNRPAPMLPPQVIIAEPYPPPLSESLTTTPTTFVAAFAMPNASIPNSTDLRNFLVPLGALERVSGMRFLGAVTGSTSLFGDEFGDDVKVSLDRETLRVRATAEVPALSGDWGGGGSGKGSTRLSIAGGEGAAAASTEGGRARVFRHLCATTSCRGL